MYNPWLQNEHAGLAQSDWRTAKAQPQANGAAPTALEVTLADFAAAGITQDIAPQSSTFYGSVGANGSSNSQNNTNSARFYSPSASSYTQSQHQSPPNTYNHQWAQHAPTPPQSSYSSLSGANGSIDSSRPSGSSQYSSTPSQFPSNAQSPPSNGYGYDLSAMLAYQQPPAQPQVVAPSTMPSAPFPHAFNQPQQQLTSFYQRTTPASNTASPPQQFISPSALQQRPLSDYGSPPQPVTPTPPKLLNLVPQLQQHLSSASFTGAGAVSALLTKIDSLTNSTLSLVDLPTRLEVLGKIRDVAGNPYFRALSENVDALDMLRDWLRAGCNSRPDDETGFINTVMPILHIIDRLPLTVENLKTSKLGKLIKKLSNEGSSPAIKDMASNIAKRWTEMLQAQGPPPALTLKAEPARGDAPMIDASASKKRKLPASASEKEKEKPAKRAAVGTTKPSSSSSSTAVKKETAKVDNSFFSSRPEKKPLPSFKKSKAAMSIVAPTPVKKELQSSSMKVDEPDPAKIAQPSSYNAFQDALQIMRKSPANKSSSSTPPIPMQVDSPASFTTKNKGKGKGKRVTWAPDDRLENIKLIERAVYEDDGVVSVFHFCHSMASKANIHSVMCVLKGMTHNLRDLEGGEGAALHHVTLFEEAIDWSEPLSLFPPPEERGTKSLEIQTQTQREQTALGTLYMSREQVPDTPVEPSHVLSDAEVDRELTTMILGTDAESIFWDTGMTAPPQSQLPPSHVPMQGVQPQSSVADLLRQIQPNGGPPPSNVPQVEALLANSGIIASSLSSLGDGGVQALLASLRNNGAVGTPAPPPPPSSGSSSGSWPGGYGNGPGWADGTGDMSDPGRGHGLAPQPPTQPGSWARSGSAGERGGAGRGARGRGSRGDGGAPFRGRGGGAFAGRGQTPCTFYRQGRCRYGDQCDFMHA
ncbi:hypothetical protein DL96DRAFT_1591014 [Flagelloscypha sp. PMI_526]|nr:hypothetical protein DL96DRAFT_1591014 [Flagelloscypha sp. PMI_526]